VVGLGRATEILCSAEPVPAAEAQRWAWRTAWFAPEQVLPEAQALAQK